MARKKNVQRTSNAGSERKDVSLYFLALVRSTLILGYISDPLGSRALFPNAFAISNHEIIRPSNVNILLVL